MNKQLTVYTPSTPVVNNETPEITVIQPRTAHRIAGWAIEVYRKDDPKYAIVAILETSQIKSLKYNKCMALFSSPEVALKVWKVIDWNVQIKANGAVYHRCGRYFFGMNRTLVYAALNATPDDGYTVERITNETNKVYPHNHPELGVNCKDTPQSIKAAKDSFEGPIFPAIYSLSSEPVEVTSHTPEPKAVGEWYERSGLDKHIKDFKKKHGVRPTSIELPYGEYSGWDKPTYYKIPVRFATAVQHGKVHLSYDPAKATK